LLVGSRIAAEATAARPICAIPPTIIADPRGALASLAPHLPNALIDEALVIARKISEPNSRATGLVSLAPAQSVNPRARHQSLGRGRWCSVPRCTASALQSSVSPL